MLIFNPLDTYYARLLLLLLLLENQSSRLMFQIVCDNLVLTLPLLTQTAIYLRSALFMQKYSNEPRTTTCRTFYDFSKRFPKIVLGLGLGLDPTCPWPWKRLSLTSLSLALALTSDFRTVLGLGLERWVLDSTSGNLNHFMAPSSHHLCSCLWLAFC